MFIVFFTSASCCPMTAPLRPGGAKCTELPGSGAKSPLQDSLEEREPMLCYENVHQPGSRVSLNLFGHAASNSSTFCNELSTSALQNKPLVKDVSTSSTEEGSFKALERCISDLVLKYSMIH